MNFNKLLKEINGLDPDLRSSLIKDLYEEEQRYLIYKNNWFYIYREPLGNPSFHLVNKSKEVHLVFQLKDFKLLERKSRKSLSNKEIKDIKVFLKQENEDNIKNVYILIMGWNAMNPKYKINMKDLIW